MSTLLRLALGLLAGLLAGLLVAPASVAAQRLGSGDADTTGSPYIVVRLDSAAQAAGAAPGMVPLGAPSAEVHATGALADVVVRQAYVNAGEAPLEAVYVVPASTRAAVYGMTLRVGERRLRAGVRKRERARADYEAAREEGLIALLLEQEHPDVLQMSIAHLPPGDTVRVALRYRLAGDDGERTLGVADAAEDGARAASDPTTREAMTGLDLRHRHLTPSTSLVAVERPFCCAPMFYDADELPPLRAPYTRDSLRAAPPLEVRPGAPAPYSDRGVPPIQGEVTVLMPDGRRVPLSDVDSVETPRVVRATPPRPVGGAEGLHARRRYPAEALAACTSGLVLVQAVVDAEGRVAGARVTRPSGTPILDREALRLVRTARFRPGTVGGAAQAMRVTLPVPFRLDADCRPVPPDAE